MCEDQAASFGGRGWCKCCEEVVSVSRHDSYTGVAKGTTPALQMAPFLEFPASLLEGAGKDQNIIFSASFTVIVIYTDETRLWDSQCGIKCQWGSWLLFIFWFNHFFLPLRGGSKHNADTLQPYKVDLKCSHGSEESHQYEHDPVHVACDRFIILNIVLSHL